MPDGATAPVVSDDAARLSRRLERARSKITILEKLIEDTTRSLYLAKQEISEKSNFLESILRSMDSAVIVTDTNGRIVTVDGAVAKRIGDDVSSFFGQPLAELLVNETSDRNTDEQGRLASGGEALLRTADGDLPVLVTVSPLSNDAGFEIGAVCVATDMSERKRLEVELRHAQKLESVGHLAAGVAHEINTPVQYIGDSVHFLGDVVNDLLQLAESYAGLRDSARGFDELTDVVAAVENAERVADLEFVATEAPDAVARTLGGIERVATIVRAMKQFSHPGAAHHVPADLNGLLDTALVVAMNEYKYIADVDLQKGAIPEVMCNEGDISQVLLNLVVNAAHAIADKTDGSTERGTITIETLMEDDGVRLSITDTGVGIPSDIQERIFDPFFTTKEPGRGTGQGLAISHSVIVDRHGGRLSVDSVEGRGSTFHVWLPVRAEQ